MPPTPEPDPVAPVKTAIIPDQTLYRADGVQTIDLADHFTHENAITYAVSSSPAGVVGTEEAAGTLTLNPLVTSQTIVTVVATADGESVSDDFIVTVMAGSEPEPVEPPSGPPTAVEAISDVTVEVGKSESVNVSSNFMDTQTLTYGAVSSVTKVTVAVSGSMVTITGVAAGSATVTVTATDPDGNSVTQPISVSVTVPMAPYKPLTVPIPGVNETYTVSIDDGQNLRSLNTDIVTVSVSGATGTLTAIKKGGPATVRILNSDQSIDGTIEVTVDNTPPALTTTIPDVRREMVPVNSDGTDRDPADTGRAYHKVVVPFEEYFTDEDGFADITSYNVNSLEPFVEDVSVVDDGLVLDVIKNVKFSFHIEISAVDSDDDESPIVLLTVTSDDPNPDTYEVAQEEATGNFDPVEVWKRLDVTHTLYFKDYKPVPEENAAAGSGSFGFNFIEAFQSDLLRDEGRWFDLTAHYGLANDAVNIPVGGQPDAADNVASYFVVTSTAPVNFATGEGLTFVAEPYGVGTPQLQFSLESNTPGGTTSASVTIAYYVVTCVAADATVPMPACAMDSEDDEDVDDEAEADREWRHASKQLRMSIVPSS